MKNEIAPEIENFKRVILELRESKEIFSCDYRFILNAASGYIFSDEENETWETIWMNDVELFSSYLENVFVLKELDEDFRPDGVGKFGRAVLGLPTSNLGVNGKRVQNHYTSLQDKFIKHNLRFSRRM